MMMKCENCGYDYNPKHIPVREFHQNGNCASDEDFHAENYTEPPTTPMPRPKITATPEVIQKLVDLATEKVPQTMQQAQMLHEIIHSTCGLCGGEHLTYQCQRRK